MWRLLTPNLYTQQCTARIHVFRDAYQGARCQCGATVVQQATLSGGIHVHSSGPTNTATNTKAYSSKR